MLYIVPTPLGNLEDITQRALRVLGSVDAVYSEDTRRTLALLTHFGIKTSVERYRDRDPRGIERILQRLASGQSLALASDAGTPVLSDPGLDLISAVRAAGLPATSLPGPCAAAAAVAGSGLPGDSFVFLGFLPRSSGRQKRALAAVKELEKTIVVYESPFRVKKLLETALSVFGPDAQASFCRELSKLHEEWRTGTIASLLASPIQTRGEFVVLFHPCARERFAP